MESYPLIQVFCEGKSIYLNLENYPHEDICVVYPGRYRLTPVMVIWGYGWQGTYAGSLVMGDPDVYREFYGASILLVRWVNSNKNDRVEMNEITVESVSVLKYTDPVIPELKSREDVISLVNQFVKTRVGETFFDDHFRVININETPELPSIWFVTYECTYNGYTVTCSVAVDIGFVPLRSSQIISELSSIVLEPQRIRISEEEARDIARRYGIESCTAALLCSPEYHRICWKIIGKEREEILLIDAENGTVFELCGS